MANNEVYPTRRRKGFTMFNSQRSCPKGPKVSAFIPRTGTLESGHIVKKKSEACVSLSVEPGINLRCQAEGQTKVEGLLLICEVCSKSIEKSHPWITTVLYWLKRIPSMGLKDRITIKFLTDSPLPMAEACFAITRLPIIHSDKETFFYKLDQGILYSIDHCGHRSRYTKIIVVRQFTEGQRK